MTYPQQPQYPAAPQAYEQPQYAQPAAPVYPPQQPTYPQAPQQYPPAPQGYQPPPMGYPAPQYPQAQPGYPMAPQQGYPQQPQAPAGPAPTLADFFAQPSAGGGAAWKFENVGDQHFGIVNRPITQGDVEPQTDPVTKQPAYYRDGRPKLVMKIPTNMTPTSERPDGRGQWYNRGAARDELARAMTVAGAPAGPPEVGSGLHVTKTGTRPSGPGMNPASVYQVTYYRPDQARELARQFGIEFPAVGPQQEAAQETPPAQAAPTVHQQAAPQPPAAQPPAPHPGVDFAALAAQQAQQQVPQPPMPPARPAQPPAQPQAPVSQLPPPPVGVPAAVQGDPAKAALFAQLTGQAAPAGA